ncbi:MAG: general secretion pathway protein GspK [Myxococcaceae bacterium]|nr:general secretion pathway protein GspK [Myxococcaceae bacterium]
MALLRYFRNGERGGKAAAPSGEAADPSAEAKRRRRERGVAMIIATISFAVLAAVAAEFSYSAKVDVAMAANTRDDTRAYFLAKSGLGLARLMLSFQKQVDNIQIPPGLTELLSGNLGGLLGGAAGVNPADPNQLPQPTQLNLQLYKLVRVDCYMLQAMVPPEKEQELRDDFNELRGVKKEKSGGSDDEVVLDREAPKTFGGFEGCFDVTIDDPEETKINLNGLDMGAEALPQALGALSAKELEFVFDHEDEHGVKVTPAELLINIHDWTDPDKVQSALDLNSATGIPFTKGFSDENSLYDRYEPRYQTKNAYFDSLDEVNMVYGMDELKLAALRDRFTVYSNPNSKPNINTDDEISLLVAILAVADPAKNPSLLDPLFRAQLYQAIRMQRAFSFLGTSRQDLISVLQAKGLVLRPGAINNISDKASTYTLHINASAGGVKKKVTAVVRMDAGGLGRLVYWREE